jgi:hypothetical protein
MNFIKNVNIHEIDVIDKVVVKALDNKYKGLDMLKIADESIDEFMQIYISIFIPFNNYHVVVVLYIINGSFQLEIKGFVKDIVEYAGSIVLCNLSVSEEGKIKFEPINIFIGKGELDEPELLDGLIVDTNTIIQIVNLIVDYYFSPKSLRVYCYDNLDDDISLDIHNKLTIFSRNMHTGNPFSEGNCKHE